MTGAAVTLFLDLPFLFVFLAVMFYYSWELTLVVLAILATISVISLSITPLLRRRLNTQFQLGARNQAFLTEYISGMETVKSLQMEPQLEDRFGDYLSQYLASAFKPAVYRIPTTFRHKRLSRFRCSRSCVLAHGW